MLINGMNYEMSIKQSQQLQNQSGWMLSKNQVFNQTRINTNLKLIKPINKSNLIITIPTINLMDYKPIKIIKEVTLVWTKITNQDIRIKTTTTTKVSNKITWMVIRISKFIKEINIILRVKIKTVTIITKQTISLTKCLNHIIILLLHLLITHK